MKKHCLIPIFLIMLFTLAGCAGESKVEKYLDEQDDIMDGMMDDMEKIQKTGSADLDFLYGMIPHHESAVAMSNSYLKYAGEDAEFKQLAEDIISAQEKEIDQMQEMIRTLEERKETDQGLEAAYLVEYHAMMEGHHDSHDSKTEDLDTAFAEGMTMHHQMAVDMAESILKYSNDEQVTTFAENIIEVQEQEITQMQSYLQKTGEDQHSHH